jgi:sialate O-acetylesterase
MRQGCIIAIAAALLPFSARPLWADVSLASPFTDHMVLQEQASVPVWGAAAPGETVTVKLGDQTQSIAAGAGGMWMVRLTSPAAGGPFEMSVSGHNAITLKDVMVGQVWLCSGQYNMDFTVAKTPSHVDSGVANEAAEVAAANYPSIRMFTGRWQHAYQPQARIDGEWKVCTPDNVRDFSAIGYFFARDVQKELNVPVGIITEAYGSSTCESWISRQALSADGELKTILDPFDAQEKVYLSTAHVAGAAPALQPQGDAENAVDVGSRPKGSTDPDPADNQHNPTVMFNGMIAPIIPYAIKGVLWYQGESILNPPRGVRQYPTMQATLVRDWRQRWGEGDFPLYIVQLPAYKAPATIPGGESSLANVRAAQQTILNLPNTGMAVTIDIGDVTTLHPKDKQDVGDRLSRIALAQAYGRPIEYSGPVYDSMAVEGSSIRVEFTHAQGLMAKGGTLDQFAVAGADGKFVWANAAIDGETVVVSSDNVTTPVAVRYAWADNPDGCSLYNGAGLPAVPFRTDAPQ